MIDTPPPEVQAEIFVLRDGENGLSWNPGPYSSRPPPTASAIAPAVLDCGCLLSSLPTFLGAILPRWFCLGLRGERRRCWAGSCLPLAMFTSGRRWRGGEPPEPSEGVEYPQALTQRLCSGRAIPSAGHEPSKHRHQDVGLLYRQPIAGRIFPGLFFLIPTTANSSGE